MQELSSSKYKSIETPAQCRLYKILAAAYTQEKQNEKALYVYGEYLGIEQCADKESVIKPVLALQFSLGQYSQAESHIEKLEEGMEKTAYRGALSFQLKKYEDAEKYFGQLPDASFREKKELLHLIREKKSAGTKSFVAGGMLALLPGLGHVYTKRYADSFMSFALVAVCTGLSYVYYQNGADIRAGAFAGISGIFYAGSIYGSLTGVNNYNRNTEKNYEERFNALFFKNR